MAELRVVSQADRLEWLRWRRQGIGASDAAAIAGFSPFDSPTSIYLKKIGMVPEDEEETWWQRMGHLLEPVIAQLFEEATGYRVAHIQERAVSPERPWQRATLDGIVLIAGEPVGPIEFKSTVRWNREWGAEPPDYYQAQLQHQHAVVGSERGWLAALTDSWRFRWWEIPRAPLDIELLNSLEEAFWKRVVERRPPPVDGSLATHEALTEAYREPARPAIDLNESDLPLVHAYRSARDARLAAEKAETRAQNAVMRLLEGAEVANWQGQPVLKWSLHERRTDDLERLKTAAESAGVEIPRKTTAYRQLWLPKERRRDGE